MSQQLDLPSGSTRTWPICHRTGQMEVGDSHRWKSPIPPPLPESTWTRQRSARQARLGGSRACMKLSRCLSYPWPLLRVWTFITKGIQMLHNPEHAVKVHATMPHHSYIFTLRSIFWIKQKASKKRPF